MTKGNRPRKIRKTESRLNSPGVDGNRQQRRLAAKLQKLAQPTGIADPRKLGGSIIGGDSKEYGTALLDATDAVLLEGVHVATIDRIKDGESQGQGIFMTLDGRINKKTDQVSVGFVFGSDGAAAIITQLLSLTDRFGVELLTDLTDRLVTLKHDKDVDLHFLKTALEMAMEE